MRAVTNSLRRVIEPEHGAAMVVFAVLLPMLVLFVSLAIDFAHFFDYSRNLQNRADAAALAAGTEYGAKCFGSTVSQAQLDTIGHAAQQYAGPPVGTPDANLPYQYTSVTGYENQPNLSAGAPENLYMILNGAASHDNGGVSFSEGTLCAANYPVDPPAVPPLPAADVWMTQEHLPLFFPMLSVQPNISAHARVQLESVGSPTTTIPIAIPDPADVPCLTAKILDQNTGNVIATTGKMTETGTSPPTWTGATTTDVSVPVTNGQAHMLSVQAFFPDDCSDPTGSGVTYDAPNQGGGIDFINGYTPIPATVAAPTLGSVWLEASGCTNSAEAAAQTGPNSGAAYFFNFTQSTSCTVTVHANAAFPAAATTVGVVGVMDGDIPNGKNMTKGSGTDWTTTFSFGPHSGRHVFTIRWFMNTDSKCTALTDAQKASNPCDFNGGNPAQESFSALSDQTDPPDDSGAVVAATVGCSANCSGVGGIATAGLNTIPTGTSATLQITFQLQGLANSGQNDLPIVLRGDVQGFHATGLIDCGQGGGASASQAAITNGCPHPLSVYNGSACVQTPSTQPWTCVFEDTGQQRNKIVQGFTDRIGSSCDNWRSYQATGQNNIDATTDPRAFVMVIVSPNDLSLASQNPNAVIHVLGFATFYVTGWDGDKWLDSSNQTIPGCSSPTDKDENYPGTGSTNAKIWGHFYKTVEPGGIGDGTPCDPTKFGDCVAALTR